MKSKQGFSNWISNRIKNHGFVQDDDFTLNNKIIVNSGAGRPSKEYFVTVDNEPWLVAKDICDADTTRKIQVIYCSYKFTVLNFKGVKYTDTMGREQKVSAVKGLGVYSFNNEVTKTRSNGISEVGSIRSPANYSQKYLYQKHVT